MKPVLDWIPAQFRSRTQLRRPGLQMLAWSNSYSLPKSLLFQNWSLVEGRLVSTTTTKRLKPFRCRCRCSRSMVTNIEICWFAFQDHPEVFEVSWGPVMFCPKLRTWTPLFQKEGWRACWMKLMVLLLTYFASSFYECPQFSGVSHVTATKPKYQSDGKQPMSLPLPVTWILTWSLFEQKFVLFFGIQDTFPVPLTAGALLR